MNMKDQHVIILLKIHNQLLDVYYNCFDGYIMKETFKNEQAQSIREVIRERTKHAISNLQAALYKLGHNFDDDEIVGDLTTKYSLKENNNVQ